MPFCVMTDGKRIQLSVNNFLMDFMWVLYMKALKKVYRLGARQVDPDGET